jgi:4'-phosphopantetheinyl transferase EntD
VSPPPYFPSRIEELLRSWFGNSAGVAVCEISNQNLLLPEEQECVQHAVPKRRHEFSTGRWCARQALSQLGLAPSPILVGRWRQPLWPDGFIGSITHASGLCAAVVVPAGLWRSIGIDLVSAEDGLRLRDAARFIATEAEIAAARSVTGDPLTLLFSAKESVVKAVSERAQRFVDFTEVHVAVTERRFKASCVESELDGWWEVTNGIVVTAAGYNDTHAHSHSS